MIRGTILYLCVILIACPCFEAQAKDKKTYAISQKIFKYVNKVNEFLDEEKYPEAKAELEAILVRRLSAYERAQINYMLGSVHYQTNNLDAAEQAFEKILDNAKGNIPDSLLQRALKILAQLNLVSNEYQQAKQYCLQLIEQLKIPNADIQALLGQIEYRLENWQGARIAIETAREIIANSGKNPKENLLLTQNAIYFELKLYQQMTETLQLLVKLYPKPTYLLYLASVYGQQEQIDKQTVIMESLYEQGLLKKSAELVNLASLYMSESVPYKSATLLESELNKGTIKRSKKNLQLLSQAWRLAAEEQKSTEVLGQAAELSEDGELYLRKAYMHYGMAQWKETIKAANQGLKKTFSENKYYGEAWLLMGMARFNFNDFDNAITACQNALEYPKSQKLAKSWIGYIANEKAKFESLQAVK